MQPSRLNTGCYKITASTTSAAVTLTDKDAATSKVIITNAGGEDVLVVSGTTPPTAVFPNSGTVPVTGKVILAGQITTFAKRIGDKFIGVVTETGVATVYISVGSGE
jgi:hypothetical protein